MLRLYDISSTDVLQHNASSLHSLRGKTGGAGGGAVRLLGTEKSSRSLNVELLRLGTCRIVDARFKELLSVLGFLPTDSFLGAADLNKFMAVFPLSSAELLLDVRDKPLGGRLTVLDRALVKLGVLWGIGVPQFAFTSVKTSKDRAKNSYCISKKFCNV